MILVFLSSIPVSVSAARGRARGRYARPTGQGNAQRSRAGDATTPHAGAASSAAVSSSASGGGTAGGSGSGSIDSYSSYSSGCVETRAESTCNVDYKSERSVQQQRRRNRQVRSAKKIAFEEA